MAANLESWTMVFEFYLKQNGRPLHCAVLAGCPNHFGRQGSAAVSRRALDGSKPVRSFHHPGRGGWGRTRSVVLGNAFPKSCILPGDGIALAAWRRISHSQRNV
jgi:hypothetical protein